MWLNAYDMLENRGFNATSRKTINRAVSENEIAHLSILAFGQEFEYHSGGVSIHFKPVCENLDVSR